MYKAQILADSINTYGQRLTTFKITFPRFILAELNTHRALSRNSASSRAIPFKKMVKMVEETPFIPIAFQKEHKGMQGSEYLKGSDYTYARAQWLSAKIKAVQAAKDLHNTGVTKQLCNRILEPFMWHTVIISGTEWTNFFKLRCPVYHERGVELFSPKPIDGTFEELLERDLSMADIHIQKIAHMMFDEYNSNQPQYLYDGQWHLPFADNIDNGALREYFYEIEKNYDPSYTDFEKAKKKIIAARCARISYETFGDEPKHDYVADIKLHDTLLYSKHASPFEHLARVAKGRYANFNGFESYRHILESKGQL